ncbi:hypothetical protein BEN49_14085 [Hymenobacter coccineus]|uniref:Fibronectin type-III domain-containing protein n=1 Tax=Hymenobacter coccineus TaxID=1908235 RepID=A0A1G1SUE8_9BACT|nr:hypothetical protein BEN49_14085 [Hymenobacter coccineus]
MGLLLLGALPAAAAVWLLPTRLTATRTGPDVRLEWSVADETGVRSYDLYRHTAANPRFQLVARRPAAGRRHYRCLDAGASQLAGGEPLTYRLVTRRPGGDPAAPAALPVESPGALARSWEVIRQTFRQ